MIESRDDDLRVISALLKLGMLGKISWCTDEDAQTGVRGRGKWRLGCLGLHEAQ